MYKKKVRHQTSRKIYRQDTLHKIAIANICTDYSDNKVTAQTAMAKITDLVLGSSAK